MDNEGNKFQLDFCEGNFYIFVITKMKIGAYNGNGDTEEEN